MNLFNKNINKYKIELNQLARLYYKISIGRITSFILALVAIVYFADARNSTAISIIALLFIISFVILIKWHNRVKYARDHAQFLMQINEEEVLRTQGDLSSFDEGAEFKSIEHPYSGDLDIFGRNSLFQLLNRTTTVTGRKMLANWLLHPAEKNIILKRQEAAQELINQPDFCQNLQATGLHFQDKKASFEPLEDWINEPVQLSKNNTLIAASYVLPLITLALLIGFVWFGVNIGFVLAFLLINGLVIRKVFNYSIKITQQTSKGVTTLNAISQLIVQVENTAFQSKLLNEIKGELNHNGKRSSDRINSLANILDFFNARANIFYGLFNIVFLFDIHLIYWAEKWKIVNGNNVKKWFYRISEFEVVSSYARFNFVNPEFSNPQIVDEEYVFEARQLGHPLIKSVERIKNDFEVSQKGKIVIITGSNMSGKSTFLRTLGVNMVLAYSGATVCAAELKLSIFQVFTNMRTQDNLEEHISSFYAELKRVKQLLALLEESELPVLFMLDEVLKGTNSLDRNKGAMAIVKQLHTKNSLGFVSTHDLELGKQTDTLAYCENYSFNSEIEDDKIQFDYKISDGICKSFNASQLMKNIGIDMD